MPAPYHNLASKLDRAIAAYLIAEVPALAEYCWPAKRSLDKSLPNVTVHTARTAPENGDHTSGNRLCEVAITIRHSAALDAPDTEADAPRLSSDALTAAVFDALNKHGQATDLLDDALTAAAHALAASDPDQHADLADFTAQGFEQLGEEQGFNEDGIWEDVFNARVLACPRDVSEAPPA